MTLSGTMKRLPPPPSSTLQLMQKLGPHVPAKSFSGKREMPHLVLDTQGHWDASAEHTRL